MEGVACRSDNGLEEEHKVVPSKPEVHGALSTMTHKWWKNAIGYQIWPASFKDSNADGWGDIPGIISKLDHLKDLGVDLIWISPVYASPQHDFGYDVANYEAIDERYGSLEDVDNLIRESNKRGMKVIMDLVINHTSIQHAWFTESKKSQQNKYSDWYIWRDPKYDAHGTRRPPNNWANASQFGGGSAWEYVPERDQYYFHLCVREQPDLNWYNAEMRQAVYHSAVEFWLKRGIAGFRVDIVGFYWKDPSFPDNDCGEELQPMEAKYIMNGPLVHVWLKEIRQKITESFGHDIVLIGELPMTTRDECLRYVSPGSRELDMTLEMDVFLVGEDPNSTSCDRERMALPVIKDCISKSQSLIDDGGWTTAFLENHDYGRSVSRFGPGDGPYRDTAAKMMALLVGALSGTMFIYQGEEIGMTSPTHWNQHDWRDPADVRRMREFEEAGDFESLEKWLHNARLWGRDNARTPVQWSAAEHAGFSDAEPWIRVNENYVEVNAADQVGRVGSVLEFWKGMIWLRKQHLEVLVHGRFSLLDRENEKVFAFLKSSRADERQQMKIVCNFSDDEVNIPTPSALQQQIWELELSTSPEGDPARLRPWEGRLYRLAA
ncbi:unnamed protein product [Zymoseptoria tritici ST99CH_1A5]|uniref:Glycosyl hydrolase family 13 catalytic domain-containing protein n=1 Tax=Zymoseptoria tritici ST99CH_1A5 TaxID=1276529 RepID=A0A1Y6M204_ZYMTR|nr:unnamed protein product [Zymoseptoria tritici ST99CH_1A5]